MIIFSGAGSVKRWDTPHQPGMLHSHYCVSELPKWRVRLVYYDFYYRKTVTGAMSWKRIVRDLVAQRRQVGQNWKERICRICDHQPDNRGVLCCLSYEHGSLLSWSVVLFL